MSFIQVRSTAMVVWRASTATVITAAVSMAMDWQAITSMETVDTRILGCLGMARHTRLPGDGKTY